MVKVVEDGVLYVQLVYGLTKYPMTPSDPSSEFADRCFGILDEVDDGEATLLEITVDYFSVTPSINVYKKEYHQQAITADVDLEVHAAIEDNASQREIIKVRRAMLLPFSLLSLVAGKKLSAAKMGKILYEFANIKGVVDKYKLVWDFLRASSTLSGAEAKPIMAHDTPGKAFLDLAKFHNFIKDRVLLKLLKRLLPLPQVPIAAVPQEMTDAIQNMADFFTNREKQEEARRIEKDKLITVSDY